MSGCRRQQLGRLEVKLRSKSFRQLMSGGQRRQLGRLKVKLKGQDQRLARIEDTNREILLKLSDLCNVVETLSTPTQLTAAQQQQQQLRTTNSDESDDRRRQLHEPDLQTPEHLFDQLRNNAKLQQQQHQPNLIFGSTNLQQQASQLGQHDQNNNDCASNVISGASSVGSSRSMSPIDSSNGHHHQQRQHDSNLNMPEHLFEQLRNSSKLQQSALMFGQTNLQQQAAQLGPHDQNNNDCARNVISAATSIGSSPSMSPIEPNNGQAHHQQHQNGHSHQLGTNSSHANNHHLSLHQTILHNLQQQQQHNQSQDQQIERHHLLQHNNQQNLGVNTNSNNNHSNGSNNQTGASSRHSSASVSPSPGPASHHSTSAVSPALMGIGSGNHSTGSHESGGATNLGALNASQAQQLIQAAVVAQQQQQQHNGNSKHHHHNNHHNHHHNQQQQPQQQDPNVAALAASAQLLSALGQFGDPELMQVQSRILASTLAAANAAGNVQQANDLASQLHRAVAAKTPQNGSSNSTSSASLILSQAVHQSNAISQQHTTSSTNNGNNNHNNNDSNNHHHHHHHQQQQQHPPQHRNSHADMSSSSSPLLSRHHQASHTTLAHQLAAAAAAAAAANSPINLGNPAAAALAAQMAAVARVNGPGQTTAGQTQQGSSGAGQGDGLHRANGGVNNQIIHSIPHPHSHHALSQPTASLLLNNPLYQTVRTKYSTRRYSRRRVGPEEAMADPAIRATAQLKMPVVPKTILIVLKHRLTVQTAITLACSQTGERLRKGAIQKKLEAMFREPGAVDAFLAEWDHPR